MSEGQRERLAHVCLEHGVTRLSLFGSRTRGTETPVSDLDLLVEFEPGRTPGFFGLAGLAQTLSRVSGNLEVDLHTPRGLSRHFRAEVVESAEVLYAAQ